MTFIAPKTMNNSIPIAVFRLLGGVPIEKRCNYKLLFDTGCARMLNEMFPDYDYITVNVYNNRKIYYDPRLFLVPFTLRRAINRSGCDMVFFPCDGNRYALFKFKIPTVVEINDLKWLKEDLKGEGNIANKVLRFFYGKKGYERTIKRASLITTISEYTKKDLLKFYPDTNSCKIHVIYLSVPKISETSRPTGVNGNEDYILNVNSILAFKNPLTLIKAFSRISGKYRGKLFFVGRETEYWKNELIPYIEKEGLGDRVVRLQNLKEPELRYLYEHARLFVTPSLHEGFGFTPIEAAIYGCPVISSKCESLPEVTMGLVNYYEPATDASALADVMLKVLEAPPAKEELKSLSETFSHCYSSQNHAKELEKLFELMESEPK